jgi:hypothetical protein
LVYSLERLVEWIISNEDIRISFHSILAQVQFYSQLIFRDDTVMHNKVQEFLKAGEKMREQSLNLASKPCESLDSELLEEDFYFVEKTGAIVTLSSCVSLIHKYCSKLPSDRYILFSFFM